MDNQEDEIVKDVSSASSPVTPETVPTDTSVAGPASSSDSLQKTKTTPEGHRVVLTVTAVIACSKGSDEHCKILDDLAKRNKKTLESPKPQQFFHCEYGIAPGQDRTVVDIVSYGIAAKVFGDTDSKVIKTWDEGSRVWIAWVNSHEMFITEDNVMGLYDHTLEFKLWDSKDKVSAKARFDRPKAFRIPAAKDGSQGKGIASIVAKQSRSWTSLQPKGSTTAAADLNAKTPEPEKTEEPKSPDPEPGNNARVRTSIGRLAGLDIADSEKKSINELNMRQLKLRKQLNKTIGDELKGIGRPESRPRESRKSAADAGSRSINIPLKLELLFSGLKEITSRLETPSVNVEDMFVSVSVGGKLMPESLERKLNPLVITIKALKDLPETPIPRNRLSDMCQPVYCTYKLLDQSLHKTICRPHSTDIHFHDVHVILAGTLDKGKLFEFLHSDGLSVEVHDRDRKLPEVVKTPLIYGDDTDDKKIANVGLVSAKNTTHNAFHDRNKVYDPFGVAKLRMNDFLQGNPTLTFTTVVNPCPLPDLLSNPNSTDSSNRLVGVVGSIDRPENPPLPTGDYLTAGTVLKVKLSLKYPLDWKMTPESGETEESCPFARIVYHFNYGNKKLLQILEKFVIEANLLALGFDQFDRKVAEAALSTYRLSEAQRKSKTLDVITGFHIMDGEFHLFVLEGLKDKAIKKILDEIGHASPDYGGFVRMLCDSSVAFQSRLYAELDINLCKIRLHQPLKTILEQPLLYIRDLVPRHCYQCLIMIKDIISANCLKDICRNALFPGHDMIISMSREFGIPITHKDFEEHHEKVPEEDNESPSFDSRKKSPRWTPIDNTNREFDKRMSDRLRNFDQQPDYVFSNIVAIQEAGRRKRPSSKHLVHASLDGQVFNYSTQSLNSTEISKTALRKVLYKQDKDGRYAYNESYNSAIIPPVDEDEHYRNEDEDIKQRWRTESGFVFPGVKTSVMCNAHPMKPNEARVEELKLQWRENTLHGNVLKPTLKRETKRWEYRHQDMNLYSKPPNKFAETPLSVHLPGVKAVEEILESKRRDKERWRSKIIVDNTDMKFHSVGSRTEQEVLSKQADLLGKILKDDPIKLALKYIPPKVPPLSVVFYPEVDRDAREAGKTLPRGMSRRGRSPSLALQPGPYDEYSLKMDKNTIPIKDPRHKKFSALKGSDFTLFLKDREYLWTRRIHPLTSKETANELFSNVLPPTAPKKKLKEDVTPPELFEDGPEDKRSEYRTRYLPSLDPTRRPTILPRDQLRGLGHPLDKDASVDIIATGEEASEILKPANTTRRKNDGNIVLRDDLQIVNCVGTESLVS